MSVPSNEYEALMICDFMEEPRESVAETEERTLALHRALVDLLEPVEMACIESIIFGGHTLAKAGEYMAFDELRAKSYVKGQAHKIRERAYDKIRKAIENGELDGITLGNRMRHGAEGNLATR